MHWTWLKRWIVWPIRALRNVVWGYDLFISYQWESGGTYAVNLAQSMRDLNYEVFLDRSEFVKGENWEVAGDLALRNTRRLVVIATRGAVTQSPPVEREVTVFTARSRHVIPIVFEDQFEDLDRSKFVKRFQRVQVQNPRFVTVVAL